jgi:hypothetical protein
MANLIKIAVGVVKIAVGTVVTVAGVEKGHEILAEGGKDVVEGTVDA